MYYCVETSFNLRLWKSPNSLINNFTPIVKVERRNTTNPMF